MKRQIIAVSLLSLAMAGISAAQEPAADKAPAAEKTPAASPRVELDTTLGKIVLELDPAKAPVSVKNFLGYVEAKYYDGILFHRVISNFMIQSGGFELKDGQGVQKKTNPPIKNEGQNGLKNKRGTIAMARVSDPDSASAQFFINVVDNPGLDFPKPDGHGYAVFGKVVAGMDVVDKIKSVETGLRKLKSLHPSGRHVEQEMPNVPVKDVLIKTARVVTPAAAGAGSPKE